MLVFLRTWTEATDDYLRWKQAEGTTKTHLFHRSRLTRLACWATEQDIELPEFRSAHFRRYMQQRSTEVSKQTRVHDKQVSDQFFRFAIEQHYTAVNAVSNYVCSKPDEPDRYTPPAADVERLLKSILDRWDSRQNPCIKYMDGETKRLIKFRDYAIIALTIETGGRIGEVLSLALEDLNRAGKEVTFRNTKNHQNRTIPLTAGLFEAVTPYLTLRDKLQRQAEADRAIGKEPRCSTHLFLSTVGTKLDYQNFRDGFNAYLKFGAIKPFTLHALRRFTLSAVSRQNLLSAMKIAGHGSLAVTQKYLTTNASVIRADHAAASPLGSVLNAQDAPIKPTRRKKITGR